MKFNNLIEKKATSDVLNISQMFTVIYMMNHNMKITRNKILKNQSIQAQLKIQTIIRTLSFTS